MYVPVYVYVYMVCRQKTRDDAATVLTLLEAARAQGEQATAHRVEAEERCNALQRAVAAQEQQCAAQQEKLQASEQALRHKSVVHRTKVGAALQGNGVEGRSRSARWRVFIFANYTLTLMLQLPPSSLICMCVIMCACLCVQMVLLLLGIWLLVLAVIYEHMVDFQPNTLSPYRITS